MYLNIHRLVAFERCSNCYRLRLVSPASYFVTFSTPCKWLSLVAMSRRSVPECTVRLWRRCPAAVQTFCWDIKATNSGMLKSPLQLDHVPAKGNVCLCKFDIYPEPGPISALELCEDNVFLLLDVVAIRHYISVLTGVMGDQRTSKRQLDDWIVRNCFVFISSVTLGDQI